jgi:hypothetical protein
VALVASLLFGAAAFVASVTRSAPLQSWQFFRYAACWIQTAIFSAACIAVGAWALRALLPDALDLRERIVLAFSAGLVALTAAIFLAGIAGVLGPGFFVALPVAALALAGPSAARELVPQLREAFEEERQSARPELGRVLLTMVGVVGILAVYLPILAPENVSYDARCYHLAFAERYAAEGAIRRFPEGLLNGTYPQAATMMYTWAFLSPLGGLEGRVELAAHLEFAVFLVTLAGIPALVRRLAPDVDARGSWVGFVLFPGIFVYDSGLVCGADHVAALFAVPIFIAALHASKDLEPRACALLAIFTSGALATKYTAASLAVWPTAVVAVCAVNLAVRRARGSATTPSPWPGVILFGSVCLVLTAQHWLRNWVFYGDPVYPVFAEHFPAHPWTRDSAEWFRTARTKAGMIPGTLQVRGLGDLLRILVTFSVEPHDFSPYHGTVPVFGSLFTASTFALPFLRGTRRIWAAAVAVYAGVALWAVLNAQDRYLQALLPWMVGVTVATLLLAWGRGRAARAAVSVLVGLQLVWAGDAWFLPSHDYKAPVIAAIESIGNRHKKAGADRTYAPWPQIGRTLPRDAHALVHEGDMHLGIGVPAVFDWLPFSFGIDYGACSSMRDVHELLRSAGVTHLVWELKSREGDSLAGDLVFHAYAARHTKRLGAVGSYAIAALPEVAPPDAPFGAVLVLGCTGRYAAGTYAMADLAVPLRVHDDASRYPAPRERWDTLGAEERALRLRSADFVVTEAGCAELLPVDVASAFERLATRGPHTLYARR